MKRNISLSGMNANTVPCGKYLKREGLFCEPRNILVNYKFALCQGKTSSSMHVITHREQQRQAFINITCKSVPSSPEHLGVRALWEL